MVPRNTINSKKGGNDERDRRLEVVKLLGGCLNPPPESIGTSRMEYYLPHELVLIGCGKRTDSVQPAKNSISRKRKKKCCTSFPCLGGPNGPTEREQLADYLM